MGPGFHRTPELNAMDPSRGVAMEGLSEANFGLVKRNQLGIRRL